jgi:phosphoribosylformylglycinamidine synthase
MPAVHRVEVRPKPGHRDTRGEAASRAAAAACLPVPERIEHASVYLLEGDLTAAQLRRVADELLADPVTQAALVQPAPSAGGVPVAERLPRLDAVVEVHPLPGVTDPAAESVELAVHSLFGLEVRVRTGDRYDLAGLAPAAAATLGARVLANPVIHGIHAEPWHPERFPAGTPREVRVVEVPLRTLSDAELERLSRDAHLFLSLDEMRAIQAEYRRLGREPREIELETLAQTWSEHCVHKTLKSTVRYREANLAPGQRALAGDALAGRAGHEPAADGSVTVRNLLKRTVAAATHELIDPARPDRIDWCLSVFVDNSGVIAFDDVHAVCFKCETHNRPSAIEPYGGAATGIGGCIRDIMGTGLGAKPIAATDIFCVAPLDTPDVPAGCLPPRRILTQVVAGVRDYGNRMGIPTVNGAVWFDPRYVGNPLVFCGVVGVMPRTMVKGQVHAGDRIVAIGGRTGRDGIHGATFSSAEVEHGHASEFSHAVQIGNAITEKKALDAMLAARDRAGGPLYRAATDCGAGGFSSAVGEMAKDTGATVHLDRAPVKYAGLTPTEVWISEAQERMVLAVPPANIAELRAVCEAHGSELCELGEFGSADGTIRLLWNGTEVGSLDTHFLHEGVPMPTREAVWDAAWSAAQVPPAGDGRGVGPRLVDTCRALLAHPNLASKAWIIRQYDHEVQGGSVVKPLVGVGDGGPSDGAVIHPVPGSPRALAIANGLATGWSSDAHAMTLAAIDECVRNLVCTGADPARIAILDNFCWPSCDDPRNMGALVRAAEACYEGAIAYRAPFISGKDSLKNQFRTQDGRTIMIPPTLLVSGFGIVERADRACTMDLKAPGNVLFLVGMTGARMGGSHRAMLGAATHHDRRLPEVDPARGAATARAVAACIAAGLVRAAHDPSEGGLLPAVAEMCFAGGLGASIDLSRVPAAADVADECRAFAEDPHRYLLEVEPAHVGAVERTLADAGLAHASIGHVTEGALLEVVGARTARESIAVAELQAAWNAPTGG